MTRWIWNRGIAALCDIRIPNEFRDGDGFRGPALEQQAPSRCVPRLDESLATGIRDRQLVWVHARLLRAFVETVLPHIDARFVLATGADDRSTPSSYLPEARNLLESPKVIHWFAQNHDGTVGLDRMSPLPLGIDFHTLAHRPTNWGEASSSPVEQERMLETIRRELPPVGERPLQVDADFTSQLGGFRRLILRIPRQARLALRRQERLPATSSDELRGDVFNKLKRNPPGQLSTCQASAHDAVAQVGQARICRQPARIWTRLPSHLGGTCSRQHRPCEELIPRLPVRGTESADSQ